VYRTDPTSVQHKSTWKELYIQQLCENKKTLAAGVSRNNRLTVNLDSNEEVNARFTPSWKLPFNLGSVGKMFNKKVPKIVTFGEGLEHSAKQLLYVMMWDQGNSFSLYKFPFYSNNLFQILLAK